jgi:hypothetical protein
MPSLSHSYVNRSAEIAAERERAEMKRQAKWDAEKARVAAKYGGA